MEKRPPASPMKAPRGILFLCIRNSARSQLAEGLARAMALPDVRIWSAGTEPSGVHPMAVQAMQEIGVDIKRQSSKHLMDVPWDDIDTVVTLCGEAAETCPAVGRGVRRVHWRLSDPALAPEAERLNAFRRTRDELRWRVAALWPRDN